MGIIGGILADLVPKPRGLGTGCTHARRARIYPWTWEIGVFGERGSELNGSAC